ncbi:MAG: 4-amino-4-deoxy-L-arabinose transferase-like glycosyltransferase, partial [Parvicellaceae bacterium]
MNKWFFVLLLVIGIAIRFFHFGEVLDSPHTWRQADTANYVYDFYKNGIDILHPSVCWMGAHKTVLLEFPLPEALASITYHLFGESHIVIRVLFFLFFLGSLFFFYRIVDLITNKRTAQIASVIFLFMPLSLFFSRAVHIDFTALFFVHAGIFLLMKGYREKDIRTLILAMTMCTLAILIKVPYL